MTPVDILDRTDWLNLLLNGYCPVCCQYFAGVTSGTRALSLLRHARKTKWRRELHDRLVRELDAARRSKPKPSTVELAG
jgi:hypothetical protein